MDTGRERQGEKEEREREREREGKKESDRTNLLSQTQVKRNANLQIPSNTFNGLLDLSPSSHVEADPHGQPGPEQGAFMFMGVTHRNTMPP